MSVTLTAEQIEQYETDGYLTPIRMLPEAETVALRAKLEAFEAKQGGKLEPIQRSKSHLLFKWLDDLMRDPRVLDPIAQLIGPSIFLLEHSLLDQGSPFAEFRFLASRYKILGPFERQGFDGMACTFARFA